MSAIKRYEEFDFGVNHKTAFTPDFFLYLLDNFAFLNERNKAGSENVRLFFNPQDVNENQCRYDDSTKKLYEIEYYSSRGREAYLADYSDDANELKNVFQKIGRTYKDKFQQFNEKLIFTSELESNEEDRAGVLKILFSYYDVWHSLKNNPVLLKQILYEAFHIRTEPVLQVEQRHYANKGLGDNQYQIGKIIIGGKQYYYSPVLRVDIYYKDNLPIEFGREEFSFYFDNSEDKQKKLSDITGRKQRHVLHMQDEKEYQDRLFKDNFLLFEIESAVSAYDIMSPGKNISLYFFGPESIFGRGFRHEIVTFDKEVGLKEKNFTFKDDRFVTIQNHKTKVAESNALSICLHIHIEFELSYTKKELGIILREEVITVHSKQYALKDHKQNKAKVNWLTDLLISYDIEQEKSFFDENQDTLIETINL